jgi:hypothetical protein
MKPKLKLEHVEDALRQAAGIISTAAKILETAYGSCTPRTVRNYIKRHPKLAEVLKETVELNLDTAESQLMTLIANGNVAAVIFYLKTKGKARGYVERVEATGSGGGPIKIDIEMVRHARRQSRACQRSFPTPRQWSCWRGCRQRRRRRS